MGSRDDIMRGVNAIIEETSFYDFPLLANEKRKKEIIDEKKGHMEEQLKRLAPELWPSDDAVNQVWNESLNHVNKSFESIPSKIKINGFYLQELLHFYSEKLGQIILSQVEGV
jgi:hypothetical protein